MTVQNPTTSADQPAINVSLSGKELLAAHSVFEMTSNTKRALIYGAAFVVFSIGFLLQVILLGEITRLSKHLNFSDSPVFTFAILSLLSPVFALLFVRIFSKRKGFTDRQSHFSLHEDYLLVIRGKTRHELAWQDIEILKMDERKKYIFVSTTWGSLETIPVKAFTSPDHAELFYTQLKEVWLKHRLSA